MALVKCNECGGMVSDKATVCPHCGAPLNFAGDAEPAAPAEQNDAAPRADEPARPFTPTEQEPEPPYGPAKGRPRRVRRSAWVLAGVVALLLVLALTCPKRQAHVDAMEAALTQALSTSLHKAIGSSSTDLLASPEGLVSGLLGSSLTSLVSQAVSSRMLQVSNYGVCSVGRLVAGKESSVVTLGVAGHVFTLFNQASLQKTIDHYLNADESTPDDEAPGDADEPDEDLDDEAA